MADPVWFWQRIVSPHMAGLAEALAATGRDVTYVAEQEMSAFRAAQGWQAPDLRDARLRFAPTCDAMCELVRHAPANSVHICQGFRGNGLVSVAHGALAARGLRQWVIIETVEENGWVTSCLKRLEYRRLIHRWRDRLEGVLAIGHATSQWLADRGMPADRVVPFAYFLPDGLVEAKILHNPNSPFRFLFVGQFIERKRVDLLIDALGTLADVPFEFVVVGSGPLEETLRGAAEKKLLGRVRWLGQQPIGDIPALMAGADCLVLPSRHDGWGAVISEALVVGTPAVCSDACGAAGAVRASGCGGVFRAGDLNELTEILRGAIDRGSQTPSRRAELAAWARGLGAAAGAVYLDTILRDMEAEGQRPLPPWEKIEPSCAAGICAMS